MWSGFSESPRLFCLIFFFFNFCCRNYRNFHPPTPWCTVARSSFWTLDIYHLSWSVVFQLFFFTSRRWRRRSRHPAMSLVSSCPPCRSRGCPPGTAAKCRTNVGLNCRRKSTRGTWSHITGSYYVCGFSDGIFQIDVELFLVVHFHGVFLCPMFTHAFIFDSVIPFFFDGV